MTRDDETRTRDDRTSATQAPSAPLVVVVSSASGVERKALPATRRVIIGRASDCDIVIEDDTVSRRHAAIHVGPPLAIEDLGSRYGSAVGGRRLDKNQRVGIEVGSVVEIGTAALVLHREADVPAGVARAPRPARVVPVRAAPVPPRRGNKKPVEPESLVVEPAMLRLYALLEVIAPSPLSVLVLGEAGTGKTAYAEAIHAQSGRSGPFVRVDCAARADAIVDLVLSAGGGTAYLEEVGALSKATQSKLLRALEGGEVARGAKPVRVVSSSSRDLAEAVASKELHAELASRLAGFSLTLPPLRKRKADVAPLARFFLARAVAGFGPKVPVLTTKTVAALESYAWPGNAHELRDVIERAAAACRGASKIEPEHLGLALLTK